MSMDEEGYDCEQSEDCLRKYLECSRLDAVNEPARKNKLYRAYLQEYSLIQDKISEIDKTAEELLLRMDELSGKIMSIEGGHAYRRGLTDAVVMLRRLGLLSEE